MKLIDKARFLQYKKSDTLVIWGSGSSIKDLKKKDFDYLNQFDSIGFNSGCELNINCTYFIVGEMLFNYYRMTEDKKKYYVGNSPEEYIKKLENVESACLIIWDDEKTFKHPNLHGLKNDYFKINQYGHSPDIKTSGLKMIGEFVDKKLYTVNTLLDKKILLHQYKGINCPVYFSKCMGYKNVVFAGIDLTFGKDSYAVESRKEFFDKWISKVHNSNLKVHPCKEYLFKFINYLKDDINFTTYTPGGLLEIIKKHN